MCLYASYDLSSKVSLHNWTRLTFILVQNLHFITPINQQTRCNSFSSLLLDVYVQLNRFRAFSRPLSGAQQLQSQPLVLPLERGGSSAVGRGRASRLQPNDRTEFITTYFN